jgi:hypothetical protein
MLRTVAEALVIFAVSIIVLYAFYAITATKATGIGWVNAKGVVLISVGMMYILCGAVLLTLKR